jgi:GcrA cell cycle regulator
MATGNNSPWPAERLERGRGLWQAGAPARVIAEALGVSRNAVIGMAHRHNWGKRVVPAGRGRPNGRAKRLREMEAAMQRLAAKTRLRASVARREAVPAPVELRTAPAEPEQTFHGPRRLIELAPGACRWPVGSGSGAAQLFCAAPAEVGESWCAEHYQRGYQRPTGRRA